MTVAESPPACAAKKCAASDASNDNGKKNSSRIPWYGPDSVHSWMTAGACALATFFGVGGRRSSGFLYVAILETFHATRSQAAWPVILLGGVLLLTGLIAGPLAHRFTARPVALVGGCIGACGLIATYFATSIEHLVFCLGITHAIGSGMLFVVIPTVINEHFIKYKGLAMGINFAGSTMGTFVFPKFLELATNQYGFKSAMLLFGALSLNAVAFGLFLRQPSWLKKQLVKEQETTTMTKETVKDTPSNKSCNSIANSSCSVDCEKQPVKERQLVPGSFRHGLTVFLCPMFYVVMYSYIAFSFAFECYISLLIDFATDRGIQVSHAVTMLSTSSVADLVGRLTLPALADRGFFTRQTVMTVSFVFMGALYLLLPLADSYALVFVMATAIAFCIGTTVVLFSVLLAEYVGVARVSMAYGMVSASAGMTSLAKPLVIGYFRDKVGAYDNLFRLCGVTVMLGAVMWIFVHMRECTNKTQTWTVKNNIPCTTNGCALSGKKS